MPPRKRQPTPGTPTIKVENVRLDTLLTDPANARMHDRKNIDAIAASLRRFGQQKPLVIDEHRVIVAGNGTYEAMLREGWEWADVKQFQGPAAEARAYAISDNRSGELASWDLDVLRDTLKLMDGPLLAATGYDENDLLHMIAATDNTPRGGHTDPDAVPAAPPRPICKLGDVWLLGDSKLLVGDCTDETAVLGMLDGIRPDMMWTDPPYGIDYVGGSHQLTPAERRAAGGKTIQNDKTDLDSLLTGAFMVAQAALRPGAPFYIAHPDGADRAQPFTNAVRAAGWHLAQTLIWVKNSLVPGQADYHAKHEPIMYGYLPQPAGNGRRGRNGRHWYGDHTATTVFDVPRPSRSEDHPTMKPVDLIAPMIANSSKPGGIVYDPFAGSGSTLVAALQTGRKARLVELDTRYADVICRRWQEFTGDSPVLARTGKARSFIAARG